MTVTYQEVIRVIQSLKAHYRARVIARIAKGEMLFDKEAAQKEAEYLAGLEALFELKAELSVKLADRNNRDAWTFHCNESGIDGSSKPDRHECNFCHAESTDGINVWKHCPCHDKLESYSYTVAEANPEIIDVCPSCAAPMKHCKGMAGEDISYCSAKCGHFDANTADAVSRVI